MSIASAYAFALFSSTSIPVSLLTETQLTPEPFMVNVTGTALQYMPSANAIPNASAFVLEEKPRISAAQRYCLSYSFSANQFPVRISSEALARLIM